MPRLSHRRIFDWRIYYPSKATSLNFLYKSWQDEVVQHPQDAMARRQGLYWLLTIPAADWSPCLPPGVSWIRGQREVGASTGYEHWQVVVAFAKKRSLSGVREVFGERCHAELSRSECAAEYVWKEDTRVAGTQFELGVRPIRRNERADWDQIWEFAKRGDYESIPADIRIRCYGTLRKIRDDYHAPVAMERSCYVYWGDTGAGKSRAAWDEAGMDSYPKDPNTKFWCAYRGQRNVIIDEFRGRIDVSHLLRWLDRYPVSVEIKGASVPLCAERIWITSNLCPDDWYSDIDAATLSALKRRMTIKHFLLF